VLNGKNRDSSLMQVISWVMPISPLALKEEACLLIR
jgi:hypothetical protein